MCSSREGGLRGKVRETGSAVPPSIVEEGMHEAELVGIKRPDTLSESLVELSSRIFGLAFDERLEDLTLEAKILIRP